jgi:ABC-type uncharacterized transport system substrate-binding protein
VSGDVTVLVAVDAVISAAKRGGIPVFTVIPPTASKGALFDLGANYYEIGRATGQLAADVLDGKSPAELPVENLLPESFVVNRLTLGGLRDEWRFPDAVVERASTVIDATGTHVRGAAPKAIASIKPPARRFRVDLIEYLDTPNVELARDGLFEAFEKAGWHRGMNFDLRHRNAQGDMATLSSMVDAAVTDDTDLIIASTTPALQGALRRGQGKPMVFSTVANPVLAGAGRSDKDHLPFVTGAYLSAPFEEGLRRLKECLPGTRRIGTLFVPAEVNSVYYKEQLEAVAGKLGLEVETLGVSSSGEVPDGALALCGRGIDVFCQISDNLTGVSFASIAQAARKSHVPIMGFASGQIRNGAFMTMSVDYFDNGVASGRLAMRVLNGEKAAQIPFEPVRKTLFSVNLTVAAQSGVVVPERLLKKADEVIP